MTGRKGDIGLAISQNNAEETLIIESIDESSGSIKDAIGYSSDELVGNSLRKLLLPRVNELIEDFLEFEDGGNDLADILRKTRDFAFVNRAGEKVDLGVRIQIDVSLDGNLRYLMIVRDIAKVAAGCLKDINQVKDSQVVDKKSNAMNKENFTNCVSIVNNYANRGSAISSFAIVSFDGYRKYTETYGEEICEHMLKEISSRCSGIFRNDDVIGYCGDGKFGVILLEADVENAKVPLNRLRWKVANQSLLVSVNVEVDVTLTIAYREFKGGMNPVDMIIDTIKVVDENSDLKNQIIEI